MIGLASSLMAEVRKDNVRVVTVCPGSVDTNFFDQPGTILNSRRETILSPDDVAAACLLAVELPQNALMNEIEIRLNQKKKIFHLKNWIEIKKIEFLFYSGK
ncbi:MAG: hypothetical protein IPG99_12060 [Ignavibacteria bacterium]|nr:hypothetical protein [Ignavibacteria bacterium]